MVVALSIRVDGKICTGTDVSTANKPVEVELIQKYLSVVKLDVKHGEPSNAK